MPPPNQAGSGVCSMNKALLSIRRLRAVTITSRVIDLDAVKGLSCRHQLACSKRNLW